MYIWQLIGSTKNQLIVEISFYLGLALLRVSDQKLGLLCF